MGKEAAAPEIDLTKLGEFTGEDAEVAETPPAEAPTDETPAEEKPLVDEPEPIEGDEDQATDEDEFEDLSLELIDERIQTGLRSVIEDFRKQETESAEPSKTPPEVKQLAEENARVMAENAELQEKLATFQLGHLEHSIASTTGKLKMTKGEVEGTTRYMELHADATRKGMTFEEAAMVRYPGIEARAREKAPSDNGGNPPPSPPAANGGSPPGPFKPVASPGRYDDITAFLLKSGKAGSLGRFI